MAFTNHAEHFLTRIDRLNTWQAELALALYRDDELVKFVLGLAGLPPGAERIALSLGDGDKGPYVIVTRKGKFVTCLGEGMKLHADQPLIGHHKLEQLSGQIERLRVMFAEARSGKRQRCDQLLMRITEAGNNITQSEFDDMAVLSPFVGHLMLDGLLGVLQAVDTLYLELYRAKRYGKQLAPMLEVYWRKVWAVSHFTLLMGQDPRYLIKYFEAHDAEGTPEPERTRVMFAASALLTWLKPWALRGAWLVAQLPKTFLKSFKFGFCNSPFEAEIYSYGIGLAAIGHRHQRYRAELSKFFHSAESHADAGMEGLTREVGQAFARSLDERDFTAQSRRLDAECDAVIADFARDHVPSFTTQAYTRGLPRATKLALALNLPLPTSQEPADFLSITSWLPVVSKMQARDFYVPDSERHRLLKQHYDYRTGAAFMSARHPLNGPAPVRAAAVPGRNEPCLCGSGKKFKRCCASELGAA